MTGRHNIHAQLHQNSRGIETKQTNCNVAHKASSIATTAVLPPGSAMLIQTIATTQIDL